MLGDTDASEERNHVVIMKVGCTKCATSEVDIGMEGRHTSCSFIVHFPRCKACVATPVEQDNLPRSKQVLNKHARSCTVL